MHGFQRALLLGSWLAGAAFATPSAGAHINLLEPPARVPGQPDSTLSLGPCGQRQNERIQDRASVFRAGQTIDLVWDVYVQHVSYFRIAFDPDGDDSFSTRPSSPRDIASDDPTQLSAGEGEIILDYILDRAGDVEHVERSVTLPDMECERCTLQLTQFTYGLPLDDALYYQCADLVLEGHAEGAAGAASGSSSAGAGPALGAGDPDAPDGASGCSFAANARARSEHSSAPGLVWLTLLAGSMALRRARRAATAGALEGSTLGE
jgi:hypothetical protein